MATGQSPEVIIRSTLSVSALACALAACAPDAPMTQPVPVQHIADFTTVISTESGLLGRLGGMAVAPDGILWLSDRANHRLVVLPPDGSDPSVIGQRGFGPGEFNQPDAIAVSDSGPIAFDFGNRRLQRFAVDGAYRDVVQVRAQPYRPMSVNERGDVAMPTLGIGGGLAVVVPITGDATWTAGEARGMPPIEISPGSLRQQAFEGTIPTEFTNNVALVLQADGALWLVSQTDGAMSRYSPQGQLLKSTQLPEATVARAMEMFFAAWKASPGGIHVPRIVLDGAAVDDEIWLLTPSVQSPGGEILVLDGITGATRRRLVLQLPSQPETFAVDPVRRVLFMYMPDDASLVRASFEP